MSSHAPSNNSANGRAKPRLFGLPAEDYRRLCAVFARHPGVTSAIIYGSRATGRHRPNSDIDLTLEGAIPWAEFLAIETELDDLLLPYTIDLSLKAQIDNPALLEHIESNGRQFYPVPALH
mgnify:CR=1 FL=1